MVQLTEQQRERARRGAEFLLQNPDSKQWLEIESLCGADSQIFKPILQAIASDKFCPEGGDLAGHWARENAPRDPEMEVLVENILRECLILRFDLCPHCGDGLTVDQELTDDLASGVLVLVMLCTWCNRRFTWSLRVTEVASEVE